MRARIFDRDALLSVSPAAVAAYARDLGWTNVERYGDHSDVYIADGQPEIIVPRTQRLGDYPSIVSRLIDIFARAAESDGLAVYRDLLTSDRDVIRVRAPTDRDAASIAVNDGLELLGGARDMLLAAACSLKNPRPLYRAGANKEATDYLDRVSLGQTEQGSFVITLLSPTIVAPLQSTYLSGDVPDADPLERRVTRRLAEALAATRTATEETNAGGQESFSGAIREGVSANLCEALIQLIEPFPEVDVSFSWARTRPRDTSRQVVRFAFSDVPVLRAASEALRARAPQHDIQLVGTVWRLTREQEETDGTITMRATVDDRPQSVTLVLSQADYRLAIQAHEEKSAIIVQGDLERFGQRWRLQNPRITDVIPLFL